MHMIRRAILAFALLAGITPAFAQVPAPVPALPDSERRTSYSISGTTCICAVNFALYGDSTDYQNWVEVFINGVRVNFNDATFGWTITSPSGSIGNLARPITDAVLTFNGVQTGTIQIVGARRPRRTSQFSENTGVPARNVNQVVTDITATLREMWDKNNDMTGRGLFSQPGNTMGPLPLPAACSGKFLGFDVTGLIPQCSTGGPGSGNVTGPGSSVNGHFAIFSGTSGAIIADHTIVGTDLPAPGASSLGGVQSLTCSTSNWFNTLSTAGAFGCSQPAFSDISGVATGAQLPNPSASTLGGVKSLAAVSHNFLTSISTAGQPTQAQPACTDLSDATSCNAARGQLPGEASTGSASAGNVGEYIESVIASGSAIATVTATAKTVTSISLTAGDWDVSGNISFITVASTSVTGVFASLSGTTNVNDFTPGKYSGSFFGATVPGATTPAFAVPVGPFRLSLSGTTNVFLVQTSFYTASTLTAYGIIRARRIR